MRGLDRFADDLAYQRRFLRTRFPLYDLLLAEVASLLDDPSVSALAEGWAARDFEAPYDRPLLLLASLRFAALRGGAAHPLHGALAVEEPDPAVISRDTVAAALGWPGLAELARTRRVQTNEVSRAVAWRWPAGLVAQGRPVALLDIGCSAGLNLVADALPARWTDAAGAPVPVAPADAVCARLGIDHAPLDARARDDADWLRACVWPGERDRLAALDAALAAFDRAPPRVERLTVGDAPARLALLRDELGDRPVILAYQTLVRDYLPPAERDAFVAGMHAFLSRDPAAAWIELETAPHGATRELPAALVATVGAETDPPVRLLLARCAYHPTTLHLDDAAASEMGRRLRSLRSRTCRQA